MSAPRNICIIAHVDHGKTTVADSLLASNGIVSSRLAGLGLRYMDSREDEQDRGITMKASCIALAYHADGGVRHAINLIDSPGHVDFSSEVSAAVRLADGALVVVDVVEGVCVQTHAVLKQAWEENVTPILVLNKIDRLILELQFTPHEAWDHIKNVIQSVNAITGHLYAGAMLEAEGTRSAAGLEVSGGADELADAVESLEEMGEDSVQEVQFSPERGNVVFASAMHGWAFDLGVFARLYAKKLGIREQLLQQTLWGEYFFHPKAKKIMRSSMGGKLKPMFVQFVLHSIWQVYDATISNPDQAQCAKMVAALQLTVPSKELHHSDPVVQLRGIMGQWLPLGRTLLRVSTEQLPTAAQAQARRLPQLCPELHAASLLDDPDDPAVAKAVEEAGPSSSGVTARATALSRIRRGVEECAVDAPALLYVAKVVCTHGVAGAHADDAFVGFARIFCGRLRPADGGLLYVCKPAHLASVTAVDDCQSVPLSQLRIYKLMGRELLPVEEMEAGSICGVGGLGSALGKGITLSSDPSCPRLARMASEGAPIVQVAVEPTQLAWLPQLERGLGMLAMADPSVEVAQLQTGEHVLRTCGEVHLERCLVDLRTTFAVGIELIVSPPMVSVLETLAPDASGRASASVANKRLVASVRAQPLPSKLSSVLAEHKSAIQLSLQRGSSWLADNEGELGGGLSEALGCLHRAMVEMGEPWADLTALGAAPTESCDNLLLSSAEASACLRTSPGAALVSSLVSGFQLAASSGPLCEEQMSSVVFVLDSLTVELEEDEVNSGQLAGQSITAMKDACRSAFLAGSTRLLEPVYKCELQTTQDIMGKTYSVLSRRRARVLSEVMREGTPIFTISAYLPVSESFGFAGELRKTTSGAAHPQLVFSHFEAMPQDPLFAVMTDEDQEALDDGALPTINIARALMNDVRRRKGLLVEDDRVVLSGTKQRTLARKK